LLGGEVIPYFKVMKKLNEQGIDTLSIWKLVLAKLFTLKDEDLMWANFMTHPEAKLDDIGLKIDYR